MACVLPAGQFNGAHRSHKSQQVTKSSNYKNADVLKRRFADSRICRFADLQIRRFADLRSFNGTALKLHRRTDASGLPNVLREAQPQARRV